MPYCQNPECPHRRRLGEPAEFNKGVEICSDCGSKLFDTVPHLKPPQKRKKETLEGWKCPECGSINREDTSICSCGFDSNRPFLTSERRARPAEAAEINVPSFGGPEELTKREQKFAEISAKKHNRFFYRNSQKIGWIGAILFIIGIFRIPPLPSWSHTLLVQLGFFITLSSTVTFAMTVAGKLYINLKALEKSMHKNKA